MNSQEPQTINTSQSTREGQKTLFGLRRKKLIFTTVLLIILVAATGWYINSRSTQDTSSTIKTRAYSFDENKGSELKFMQNHFLQGSKAGRGMIFNVPWADFLYADAPLDRTDPRVPKNTSEVFKDKGDNVELGQRIIDTDRKIYLQTIVAGRIVPPAEVADFSSYAYFRQLIAKLSFPNLETSQVELQLGTSAKRFTNPKIKLNGGIFDFTVSPAASADSGPIKQMTGQLIQIKGKKAMYYLVIAAIDENWNSSPKTWQAIKDSIKVDQ